MALPVRADEGPVVVTRLEGGLGNQLFQYAAGCAAAKSIEAQKLYVDISKLPAQGHSRALRLFNFNVNAKLIFSDPLLGMAPDDAVSSCGSSPLEIIEERAGTGLDLMCTENLPSTGCCLSGFWQTSRHFKDVEEQLRRDLVLRDGPRSNLRNAQKWLRSLGPTVAVHVRRGDYLTGGHGALPVSYYEDALDWIGRTAPEQPMPIYFSDDQEWVRDHMLARFGGALVFDHFKLRDFEELVLMSTCTHHVIANSTFSWWAAWLGKSDRQIVVYPHPWFAYLKGSSARDDMCPVAWQRLELRRPFDEAPPRVLEWRSLPGKLFRYFSVRARSAIQTQLYRRRARKFSKNVAETRPSFALARASLSRPQVEGSARNVRWICSLDFRSHMPIKPSEHDALDISSSDIKLNREQMRHLGLAFSDYNNAVVRVFA